MAESTLGDAEVAARGDEDLRAVEVAAGVWGAADPGPFERSRDRLTHRQPPDVRATHRGCQRLEPPSF